MGNLDLILESPYQVYNSAGLSPPSSWLHEHYSSEFSQEVKVMVGLEWEMSVRTILQVSYHLAYRNNAFAADSAEDITIIDAITGTQIAVFMGCTRLTLSLAFSLDGTLLASGGYDRVIQLWDVQLVEL
jgi:WD40 repeat protein